MHFDLVISGEGIHEAKEFILGGCINNQINLIGRGKLYLGQALFKLIKSTLSPLSLLWGGDDDIDKPI